ncbi:MAG: hypothetical protein ACO2PM_02035 [Pyrobaculum sp.]
MMLGVDLGTVRNGVVMVWRGKPLLHAVVPAEGLKRILSGVRGVSEISVGFSPYVDSSEILGVLKALCGTPPRQAGGREQGLVGPLLAEAEVPRAGRGRDRRPELRFGAGYCTGYMPETVTAGGSALSGPPHSRGPWDRRL